MIRIQLVHEGRVVKQITSRIHESVVLEQINKYKDPFDEIYIVEGDLSEGAKDMLKHVAKKIVPAAMAAGLAMGSHGANAQQYGGANPNYPGLDRSISQHVSDIFSPNYKEIQRQRQYELQTRQQEWNAEQNEIRRARIQAAQQQGRAATGQTSSNVKVYDQARRSADGKYFLLYDMNDRITRIPVNGTEFMQADSQRLPHYIAPNGSVYYVRHPVNESVVEGMGPTPTIPASGTNPGSRGAGTMSAFGGAREDDDTANADGTTNIEVKNGQLSIADKDPVEEAAGNVPAELQAIFDRFPQAWADFKSGGDLDDNPEFYEALFNYYSELGPEDGMPYGTQKARDGDPYQWIADRLDDLTGQGNPVSEADDEASPDEQASADKNIIMQIRKASDYEKASKLSLADGSTVNINATTAKKILAQFDVLKPATKELMQQTLNTREGFSELLNFFNEREVHEDADVDSISNGMAVYNEAEVRVKRLMNSVFGI